MRRNAIATEEDLRAKSLKTKPHTNDYVHWDMEPSTISRLAPRGVGRRASSDLRIEGNR